MRIAVIGGGAAGFFAAIHAATANESVVEIYEATDKLLEKVILSGGGRCNVTHHCFEPKELVKQYPRGAKELLSPFHTFQPQDMISWLKEQGVEVKTEDDGRIFPITDSSKTIAKSLVHAARQAGVKIHKKMAIKEVTAEGDLFVLQFHDGSSATFDRLIIATGSSRAGYRLAEGLGHTIVPPVPSLFTFKIKDSRLDELAGISFEHVKAVLRVGSERFEQEGPLLITHWGMSGPVILRLSAFAARKLYDADYKATLIVDFIQKQSETIDSEINKMRDSSGKKLLGSMALFDLSKRYWQQLLTYIDCPEDIRWNQLAKPAVKRLKEQLRAAEFPVTGKGVFKEEFVTCGGVTLMEIDFKSMESKIRKGLFFAGEILDIDGVTGGFNFQNSWTTGYIAGRTASKSP